jgi:hypothetical protein
MLLAAAAAAAAAAAQIKCGVQKSHFNLGIVGLQAKKHASIVLRPVAAAAKWPQTHLAILYISHVFFSRSCS